MVNIRDSISDLIRFCSIEQNYFANLENIPVFMCRLYAVYSITECPKGECASTNILRTNASRMSSTILIFTFIPLSSLFLTLTDSYLRTRNNIVHSSRTRVSFHSKAENASSNAGTSFS